jgi:hypothetical protein
MRKIWGAIVGLLKGFVLIVALILILQNIDFISIGGYIMEMYQERL